MLPELQEAVASSPPRPLTHSLALQSSRSDASEEQEGSPVQSLFGICAVNGGCSMMFGGDLCRQSRDCLHFLAHQVVGCPFVGVVVVVVVVLATPPRMALITASRLQVELDPSQDNGVQLRG
mmetsp:Transcript_110195/g.218920  ORF Transcript_110195/g.218920 Transcript_110195/m.218920 type:complete len:122 (-) Transcript_110195:112-477(-)